MSRGKSGFLDWFLWEKMVLVGITPRFFIAKINYFARNIVYLVDILYAFVYNSKLVVFNLGILLTEGGKK